MALYRANTAINWAGLVADVGAIVEDDHVLYATFPSLFTAITATDVGAGGVELGYAEITSVVTGITAVGAANRVDLSPALSVDVTVGTRPITVECGFTSGSNDTADRGGGIAIVEGTTILAQSIGHSSAANLGFPIKAKIRLAPSAGAHTYKVMGYATTSGTFTPLAGSASPAFLQVIEV